MNEDKALEILNSNLVRYNSHTQILYLDLDTLNEITGDLKLAVDYLKYELSYMVSDTKITMAQFKYNPFKP